MPKMNGDRISLRRCKLRNLTVHGLRTDCFKDDGRNVDYGGYVSKASGYFAVTLFSRCTPILVVAEAVQVVPPWQTNVKVHSQCFSRITSPEDQNFFLVTANFSVGVHDVPASNAWAYGQSRYVLYTTNFHVQATVCEIQPVFVVLILRKLRLTTMAKPIP